MIKEDPISYERIAKAQMIYSALGYLNVETPWTVSPKAILATLPPGVRAMDTDRGCLVGSGEQGFIQMMLDGTLEPGYFQTATPCFRDEQVYTDLNRPSFFKVELIAYMPEDATAAYQKVLNDAINCSFAICEAETLTAVTTAEGYDVLLNGIEIGSFGVRKMDNHVWVYGTGIAEPRFSLALKTPAPVPAPAPVEEPAAFDMKEPVIPVGSFDGTLDYGV